MLIKELGVRSEELCFLFLTAHFQLLTSLTVGSSVDSETSGDRMGIAIIHIFDPNFD